jgi:hypothetical protein
VSHALAQVLAATGYWPPDVPFTLKDLNTTLEILVDR